MDRMWENFQSVTDEQWREAIVKELKGADYNTIVHWSSPEGIIIEPFYTTPPTLAPPAMPQSAARIAEYLMVTDINTANAKALEALQGGAEMIVFDLHKKSVTADDIKQLLEGILLEVAPVWFINVVDTAMISHILEVIPSGESAVCSTDDAITGKHVLYTADMRRVHYDVGNMVEELVSGLKQANDHLVKLTEQGMSVQDAAMRISFHTACGSRYLFEICKLRALHWLWASLCKQYGVDLTGISILAESSTRSFTKEDIHTNMLRNTAQVMSALLGGASAIYACPHGDDNAYPGFGERMARNIQLLLRHESHIGEVVQVPEGAWFFDRVTAQLAEKAWEVFRKKS